jgi:hypothetical protein
MARANRGYDWASVAALSAAIEDVLSNFFGVSECANFSEWFVSFHLP